MGLFGGVSNEDLALLIFELNTDVLEMRKMFDERFGDKQEQQEAEHSVDMQLLQKLERRFGCLEEQQAVDRDVAEFRVGQCFEQLTKAFDMIQELQERRTKEDQEYENYEHERKGLRSEFV